MKVVLTYGTFDLFHKGHVKILERSKALGDYLIVALSTDEFNSLKGKKAYYSYEDRKCILEALSCVDLVIPENTWEQKLEDVKKYNVDIVVMGSDWKDSDRFNYLKEHCELVFLPRTPDISTTKIKNELLNGNKKFINKKQEHVSLFAQH